MPIIHFINSKTQTAGSMKNVLAYVTRTEKTQSEDKQYVTALNCNTATAYDEMLATKNAYHKNSGRMYYHLVQSFPKGDGTSPELAHQIAVELAEKAFGKYECVVATHIDREHIHSHIRIQEQSKKYDKIVRDWQRQKPAYERKIEQYKARITALRQQIEELILERISDREHASVYNSMITKREEEIADLQQKIEESKQFDEVSKRKRNELKTTADLLEKMIEEQHISDANLRLLVKTVYVHQNEDKSLDVRLEFNGDFEDSVAVYIDEK